MTRGRASDLAHGRYRIGDGSFSFAAAHRISSLPAAHKAARRHGHTFTVDVELTDAELQAPGFVADFADLAPVGDYLKRELDHRDLDTLFTFDTTTDALAQHITAWFLAHMPPDCGKQLHAVHVAIGASPRAQQADEASFTFEAAHHLNGLPNGHKCGRDHGHSYRVDLHLAPRTDLRRRTRLCALLAAYLDQCIDHRDLNGVLDFPPTSELLAEYLYACLVDRAGARDAASVHAVRVWESPRRWAEFSQDERIGQC
ncbi:6-carboxytetrahydropterin synthase [Amycolatopsis sp. cmx-4-54]|uniref:6-carboxytetrahydropterin synthase n=1 Tax=Amycolatopsis sp. cmx-4-54 TaxID=2790936 RepID=UPI0039793FB9